MANVYEQLEQGYKSGMISKKEYESLKRRLEAEGHPKPQKSTTTTQQSASIPQSTWEQMPANIKSNIISSAQATGIDPTPGKIAGAAAMPLTQPAEQPIVQQPTFDPYRYIKELQDAARSKPTKELRATMAKELSRID